jgi:hypothetical protein
MSLATHSVGLSRHFFPQMPSRRGLGRRRRYNELGSAEWSLKSAPLLKERPQELETNSATSAAVFQADGQGKWQLAGTIRSDIMMAHVRWRGYQGTASETA